MSIIGRIDPVFIMVNQINLTLELVKKLLVVQKDFVAMQELLPQRDLDYLWEAMLVIRIDFATLRVLEFQISLKLVVFIQIMIVLVQ